MKTQTYILAFLSALTFSMCNNSKKEDVVTEKTASAEKDHHALTAEDSVKLITHQIEVKGEVEFPLELNADSLQKMKFETMNNAIAIKKNGRLRKNNIITKGVLLKDILEKAKIKQNGHKDRDFYIVARASDNYKAIFSWAEIFNNPTGDSTFVLFEENGKPAKKGDMVLFCKNDIDAGPRHVYWLKSIEVYRVK
jgi:type III secretory pathway component EscV